MKKKKIIITIAASLLAAGIVIGGCLGGTYYINRLGTESKIEEFNERMRLLEDSTTPASSDEGEAEKTNRQQPKEANNKNTEEGGFQTNERLNYNIDVSALRRDCENYNNALLSMQTSKLTNEDAYTYAAIDLEKYGIPDNIFGYIKAPAIGMELPIYLGANEYNMMYGAAHFCYTSLPIGGENTNAVFAGHTGYIGRWLFDDIGQLNEGDTVTVSTYLGTLDYKVKEVKIKSPSDSNDIYIERGKDKITLVTCTYLSDGTYMRYVVVCERAA